MDRYEEKERPNGNNRKRNRIVNFRMSQLEFSELERRVKLSGRMKQDYMIQSTLYQNIVIVGDRRLAARIMDRLEELEPILRCMYSNKDLDPIIIIELRNIFEIVNKWK
jgi:hypothetical protein